MHHETTMTKAREAAKTAWDATGGTDVHMQFSDDRFEAALRAYMAVLVGNIAHNELTPQAQKAVDVNPVDRSPGEHFLAMCNQHYEGYTLTAGVLPDNILRKIICFQPDRNSSVLYPLFISLQKMEMEHVMDPQGRPFLIAITGGDALTMVK